MKNIKQVVMFAAMVFVATGCKKFLNVTPIEAQSGNNFWKNRDDVEKFTNGIYARLKDKVAGVPTFFRYTDKIFFPALEVRGNNVTLLGGDNTVGRKIMSSIIVNDLRTVMNEKNTSVNANSPNYPGIAKDIMDWKVWYDIIAASNILHFEIDKVPSSSLSDTDRKRYKAEAVFMRNLSYMFICKLFGDAVYYTDAYHSKPLGRTPQVEVMKKCIADMNAAKNDLPGIYSDGMLNGFRPTKASAVALLMHLNMWAAAWETGDKSQYYQAVVTLAEELDTYTQYKILDITPENTLKIFKGRSSENLFGILQDVTYGESFAQPAGYSYFFAHFPYQGTPTKLTSFMTYDKGYMQEIFPPGITDARLTTWFENHDSNNGNFQFKKFANLYTTGSGAALTVSSDDSAIIFRLPDCYLLTAEALAELDDDAGARDFLNRVRKAASAPLIALSGTNLKDEIYLERCRELIGEGQFFFDLVRTKRVVNSDYTKSPISVANLNAGAWTWPLIISETERQTNPSLVGNNFWN